MINTLYVIFLALYGFMSHINAYSLCNTTISQDISICRIDESFTKCAISAESACLKKETVSQIHMFGITYVIERLLNTTMNTCCDPCQSLYITKIYNNTMELQENIENGNENSTFIFPILGTEKTEYLYGRFFIPVVSVESTVLITQQVNGTMIVRKMINSCLTLLPLFGICIMMALGSGFIIWILDTWSNEEQFPRNFVSGVYEGFWWAFISMTTVGYGDKTPVSLPARIYGIFWIIVGITICSMLTAALTTIITSAAGPPSTHITGKKIAVLKHRLLDSSYVLSNGGKIKEVEDINFSFDMLQNMEVHGLITDQITASFYRMNLSDQASKYNFQNMPLTSRDYSYGILINDKILHDYLRPFFKQNSMLYETCNLLKLGSHTDAEQAHNPFHPKHGVFWPAVLSIVITCSVFSLFGIIFECIRRRRSRTSKEKQKKRRTENDIIDNMKSLLRELTDIKKKEKQSEALL